MSGHYDNDRHYYNGRDAYDDRRPSASSYSQFPPPSRQEFGQQYGSSSGAGHRYASGEGNVGRSSYSEAGNSTHADFSYEEGPPGPSLKVQGLTTAITKDDLWQAFAQFGMVRDVYVPRDYNTKQPKDFAFVKYDMVEEATRARSRLNGCRIKGAELRVGFSQSKRKTKEEMESQKGPRNPSVCVRNLSPEITTEDLRNVFSRVGSPKDVYIPFDFASKQRLSHAYVEYDTLLAAQEACNVMDGCHLKGQQLQVSLSERNRKDVSEQVNASAMPSYYGPDASGRGGVETARPGKRSSLYGDGMDGERPTARMRFSDDAPTHPLVEQVNPPPATPTNAQDVETLCQILLNTPSHRESGWIDGGALGTPFKQAVNVLDYKPRFQRARTAAVADGYIEIGRLHKKTGVVIAFAMGQAGGPDYSTNIYARLTAKGFGLVKRDRGPLKEPGTRFDSGPASGGVRLDDKEGPPGTSLMVRQLSQDTTEEDLRKVFGRVGPIVDVYFPRNIHTGQLKGFAFVEYASVEVATEARSEMDQCVIKGQEVRVTFGRSRRTAVAMKNETTAGLGDRPPQVHDGTWSSDGGHGEAGRLSQPITARSGAQSVGHHGNEVPGPNLIVRNLTPDTTPADLRKVFGRLGTLEKVYIPRDIHAGGELKDFAIVTYEDVEAAIEARSEMDQCVIKGQQLKVRYTKSQRRRSAEEMERERLASELGTGPPPVVDGSWRIERGQDEGREPQQQLETFPSARGGSVGNHGAQELSGSVGTASIEAQKQSASEPTTETQAQVQQAQGGAGEQESTNPSAQPEAPRGAGEQDAGNVVGPPGAEQAQGLSDYEELLAHRRQIDQQLELLARRREIDLQLERLQSGQGSN